MVELASLGYSTKQENRHEKPKVAIVRKIDVILHCICVDGTTFKWGQARVGT